VPHTVPRAVVLVLVPTHPFHRRPPMAAQASAMSCPARAGHPLPRIRVNSRAASVSPRAGYGLAENAQNITCWYLTQETRV